MSKDKRYDVVIVGGGSNGLGIAAYLAKCGVKVCLVEARREVGGGCETIEPIPGSESNHMQPITLRELHRAGSNWSMEIRSEDCGSRRLRWRRNPGLRGNPLGTNREAIREAARMGE